MKLLAYNKNHGPIHNLVLYLKGSMFGKFTATHRKFVGASPNPCKSKSQAVMTTWKIEPR
jgi:hypothetical protein